MLKRRNGFESCQLRLYQDLLTLSWLTGGTQWRQVEVGVVECFVGKFGVSE